MAAWMFANGVSNPTAAEAARLRRLFERLVDQRRAGDFDGAVATWLETRLGSGVRPTRMERKTAAAKMRAFFDAAAAPGGAMWGEREMAYEKCGRTAKDMMRRHGLGWRENVGWSEEEIG
eukprot:4608734-Prymnesium_polylepis.1